MTTQQPNYPPEPQMPLVPELGAPEAAQMPEPLDPEYAGTEEQRERAVCRLMDLLRSYKKYREEYVEPIWNETYRAYMGVPPQDNNPYGSFYHIAEIFRQVEVLKPQLAAQLLPSDQYFRYKPQMATPDADYRAQAATQIVHQHLRSMNCEPELLTWLDNCCVWGISYLMDGWKRYRRTRLKIAKCIRKDQDDKPQRAWMRETQDIAEEGVYVKWVNHWQVYVDWRCPNLDDSPGVFLVERVSAEDMKTLVREGELDAKAVEKAIAEGGDSCDEWDFRDRPEDEDGRSDSDVHPNKELEGLFTLITVWTNDHMVYSIINQKHMARAQFNFRQRVPMKVLRNYPQPGQHYGLGEPFMLLWDQKLLDDAASQFIDAGKYALNPMFVVAAEEKKKWQVLSFKPGAAVFPNNIDKIKALNVPQLNFPLKDVMDTLRRNMQLASGNTDEMQGITRHRTATGVKLLQDAAAMRINHKVRWHMPVFKRLWLDLYTLEAHFLDQDFAVRVRGRDGKEFVDSYGPNAFEPDVDVSIELPPEMQNDMERRNQALQFYQQTAGSGDPRWKFEGPSRALLEAFGHSDNQEDFVASELEDLKLPVIENDIWRQTGLFPPVRADQNHQVHLQTHQEAAAQAQQAVAAGMLDPGALHIIAEHMERHAQYLQQIQQAMAQQAQQAPVQQSGSPMPQADMRTEANFANSVTGAAQQGTMPRSVA
jgi:hypothetical protein